MEGTARRRTPGSEQASRPAHRHLPRPGGRDVPGPATLAPGLGEIRTPLLVAFVGKKVVRVAGVEPALLSELDFEVNRAFQRAKFSTAVALET